MKQPARMILLIVTVFSVLPSSIAQSTPTKPPKGPAIARFSPITIDFGNQAVGRLSRSRRITVTNDGETKLYVNNTAVSGDHPHDFTIVHDTCTNMKIGQHKSCLIDVSFAPSKNEPRKATIVFTDNANDSPQSVTVSGNGLNSSQIPPR